MTDLVLAHATLARAEQHALDIATRMAKTAIEAHDVEGTLRWSQRCAELRGSAA